jgi:hypothetical protein
LPIGGSEVNADVTIVDVGTNEVVADVNVLSAVVVFVIFGQFNCSLVILVERF